MLIKIFFFLFTLTHSYTYASELNLLPLLKILEPNFLEQEQQNPSCVSGSFSTVNNPQNLHSDCIKDICGAPNELVQVNDHVLGRISLNENVKNLEETTPSSVSVVDPKRDLIEKKIKKYFRLKKREFSYSASDSELASLIEKKIKELQQTGLDKNLGVFMKAVLLRSNEKLFESIIQNADFDIETLAVTFNPLDYELFSDSEKMKNFTKNYEKWINSNGLLGLRAYDPREFIAQSYPNESFENGIKLYLEKAMKLQGKLDLISPLYGARDINNRVFLDKLERGLLTETDLKVALNAGFNIENRFQISKLITGSDPSFTEEKLTAAESNFNDIMRSNLLSDLVERVKEAILELKSYHEYDTYSKERSALESCLSSYDYNKEMLPTDSQIEKLNKVNNDSKAEFISAISSYKGFSEVSKPIIMGLLEDVKLSLPFSSKSWSEMIEENIDGLSAVEAKAQSNLNLEEVVSSIIQATVFQNNKSDIVIPNLISQSPISLISDNTDDPIIDLCLSYQQKPFTDANLTATGIVSTSYTSAFMSPEEVKSIIFHEMSHSLEVILANGISAMTNTAFKSNRECINQMHSYIGEADTSDQYRKEDFADFMASELLPKNSSSSICQLVDYNQEFNRYNVDSFQSRDSSTHSSHAFRLLRFSIDNRQTLPGSCVQAAAYEGITSVSATCSF